MKRQQSAAWGGGARSTLDRGRRRCQLTCASSSTSPAPRCSSSKISRAVAVLAARAPAVPSSLTSARPACLPPPSQSLRRAQRRSTSASQSSAALTAAACPPSLLGAPCGRKVPGKPPRLHISEASLAGTRMHVAYGVPEKTKNCMGERLDGWTGWIGSHIFQHRRHCGSLFKSLVNWKDI